LCAHFIFIPETLLPSVTHGAKSLGLLALAQEQASGLGEGPLEVGVADLVAAGALLLAGRLVGAADQPGQEAEYDAS